VIGPEMSSDSTEVAARCHGDPRIEEGNDDEIEGKSPETKAAPKEIISVPNSS